MTDAELKKNLPLISVVITNYNYEEFIKQAIDSVINQTYKNLEIILIDDASNDNSRKIYERFREKIKIVEHKANIGITKTRNEALKLVSGKYMIFLDADDFWDADYLKKMLEVAEKNRADVTYSNWRKFGDLNEISDQPEFQPTLLQLQQLHVAPASLMKISSVRKYKFESMKIAEDWDFFLKLSLEGLKFTLAKDCFFNYRIRFGSRSSSYPEVEILRDFVKILEKYRKTYGKKVVNPTELLLQKISEKNILLGNYTREYGYAMEQIEKDKNHLTKTRKEIERLRVYLDQIISSRSYKIGYIITLPVRFLRKIKFKQRTINIIKRIKIKFSRKINEKYFLDVDGKIKKNNNLAVIVHLFYTNNWPLFSRKLIALSAIEKFDLFITIPESNQNFISKIRKIFPETVIYTVPNRGRDVLPFIKVANLLLKNGYDRVLKFHSKKSTHWDGGQDWLKHTMDALIPDDENKISEIVKLSMRKTTGVIGPKEYYYSSRVNLEANLASEYLILNDNFGRERAIKIMDEQVDRYGFFGGTMFWLNLEAVRELIGYGTSMFEREAGQIDGTFAHALERLFTIFPEVKGDNVYAVEPDGSVKVVKYSDGKIPDWFEGVDNNYESEDK